MDQKQRTAPQLDEDQREEPKDSADAEPTGKEEKKPSIVRRHPLAALLIVAVIDRKSVV